MTGPDLRLDCDCRMPAEVASYVCALARRAGLSASSTYWLRLAVEEITSNVAEHGYQGEGPLELAADIDEHRVLVRIEDEGPAFDPRQYEYSPPAPDELTTADAGGHGIFLALRNLDAFEYERVGGRNRNTLIMSREGDRDGAGTRADRGRG